MNPNLNVMFVRLFGFYLTLFYLSMRDGQQNQSIRYEVKLLLKQTAYYESEDALTWCKYCFAD